jgi:Domain of unknown function (DUF1788)
MNPKMTAMSERLFGMFVHPSFLAMKAQANEMPIFIQAYEPNLENSVRRMIGSLAVRLRNAGVVLTTVDLFDVVLQELEVHRVLDPLLHGEAKFGKRAVLETLQNYSDPKTHLIPRLVAAMQRDGAQLSLITGSGRLFPFLRTHTILEALQPAMVHHPVVIFFPGEYDQNSLGGSHLRLFGSIPSPKINNPYYRATNLDHYRL